MLDLSKLDIPLFLAPMAGGFNTPALVAAVADSGGVGSFGFAYTDPEGIDSALAATRALTDGLLNANFFIFPEVTAPGSGDQARAIQALGKLPEAAAVELAPPKPPYAPDLAAQLEPVWAHRPSVLTFHFGIPHALIIDRAHSLGISVGVTATCVQEALAIQAAGADFIVAQGWEAGGHRGCFDPQQPDEQLGVRSLTRRLVETTALPVVAAGGLVRGSDIADVLNAGAVAAQLGSAFLLCPEAGTPNTHRQMLMTQAQRQTAFTRAFSGRPARGLRNRFMDLMHNQPYLPFPLQNTLTGQLRSWAGAAGQGEFQSVWVGTGLGRLRARPAKTLVAELIRECELAGATPNEVEA